MRAEHFLSDRQCALQVGASSGQVPLGPQQVKTAAGGVESVVANDAQDQQQMGLIRSHLRDEATKFTQGNYADPARIHGMDMPGLKELEVGYSRVLVVYADQPNGANITYTSSDPVLVEAIHAWFDRQLADHGSDATGG